MDPPDSASDCDCGGLSVHSFINHRGEAMRGRRARSGTRRTRGLGEVRSVRSRSSDQMSDLPSDMDGSVRSLPTVTLRNSRSQSSHVLQYNGELFVPVRAVNPGPPSRPPSTPAVAATHPSTESNLPDYMYYNLRTQPSAGDARAASTVPTATEAACPTCAQLRARIKRLEKDHAVVKAENRSLAEQLKAARRGRLALERQSVSEFEETLHAENEALRAEAEELKEMLSKAGGDSSHTGTVGELREMLIAYVDAEKRELTGKLAASRETIAETQEALLEERKARREDVSAAESRLISDNTVLTARNAELEHKTRLGEQRRQQLVDQVADMTERVHELTATLGQTPGILPDLSADESEILLGPWCDLPEEVTECMDSSLSLQRLLSSQDGLQDKDEMIRCLWYRAKVSAKALQSLQARLDVLGVTSEDKLGELSEVGRRLWEKENKIKELELNLRTIADGQTELERQHRDRLGALVQERNDALARLDTASAQNRLLEVERQQSSGDAAYQLQTALLQKLSDVYEGADARDHANRLAEENALLRVGRETVDESPASIHEVLRLTDPQALRSRCVTLANERDHFLAELRLERDRNSDERRAEHQRNLEHELAQTAEDRKELRQQVAHFSSQLNDALSKHEEQMTSKEREITVLRLKLQEMGQERDDVRLEWEKERRNANDLKVTYHKEIKNQSQQVDELRRELDLAQRQVRSAQAERDSLLDEVKAVDSAAKDRQRVILSAVERCDGFLQSVDQEDVRAARELLSNLTAGAPVEEEEISAVKAGPQLAAMPVDNQLQSSAQRTDEVSSDVLGKLSACLASPSADQVSELRAGVLDMTAKFDLERRAYRAQLQQVLVDLRSAQSRLRAAEETKGQLETACQAFEKKLATVAADSSGSKALKEENNRLLAASAAADKQVAALRARVDQLRREKRELRQTATHNDARAERLRQERDALEVELRHARHERDRHRANLAELQERAAKLEQQLRVLSEQTDEQRRAAKERNAEIFGLRDSLMGAEQDVSGARQEAASLQDQLRAEAEASRRAQEAKRVLEAEIQNLKAQLLGAGDGDSLADVARKIQELKDHVTELQRSLRVKDTTSQDLQGQLDVVMARVDDLEAELAQERSLLVVAKTRCEALEDENEWLRMQNDSLNRRAATPRGDLQGKSRGELINQLILRSHTKAQAMLASNRGLSLTPNGLASPSSEVTEHLPFFLNHSMDL